MNTFQTKAKVVEDSINNYGARITTFEVEAPRFLLAEVNTHRVIARSAASSRAIPVSKRVSMVRNEPYVPASFGKNRAGMQSVEDIADQEEALSIWLEAAKSQAAFAERLDKLGVHKQQANRLIEPFVGYHGVMTGTEWDNFFRLRNHSDADPAFETLARLMYEAYSASDPVERDNHLPYRDADTELLPLESQFKVSSARCARISYKTFDGKASTLTKDLELCQMLISSGHLSPFDHVATTDTAVDDYWLHPDLHRHLYGWIPYRTHIETELGLVCARDSYGPISENL